MTGIKQRGWIGMERVREIFRLAETGMSMTAIGRSVGVSRQTVRSYLSGGKAFGLSYEQVKEMSAEELSKSFEKRRAGRRVKDANLDYQHLRRELSRKGVTLLLLWEEYLREHPTGYSYSQFCERYNQWRKGTELSMRQHHRAGEKMFIDYAGQTIPIIDRESGTRREASIFVSVLGASNYTFAEATGGESLKHWLGSRVRAFEFYAGVPEIGVPDNLKSGVKSPCRYDPEINQSYRDLAEHYGIAIVPARVRKPKDKAKVEGAVRIVSQRILAALRDRTFYSLDELNAAIKVLLVALNERPMKGYAGASRKELFEELDKPVLKPLPQSPYQLKAWKQAKVNIDYHIEIKRHYYSVPYQLIHKQVNARIGERTIEVFYDGRRVAMHRRDDTPGRATTSSEHMPPSHRYMQGWTPSRFLRWAIKIGPETRHQVDALLGSRQHPEQSYRACLGLLSLAKKFGAHRLETACGKANHYHLVSQRRIRIMLQTGSEKMQEKPAPHNPVSHSNIRGSNQFH